MRLRHRLRLAAFLALAALLLPLVVPAAPAAAAISFVQNLGTGSGSSTTSITITPTATVTAGNSIIVFVGTGSVGTNTFSCSDSVNGAYHVDVAQTTTNTLQSVICSFHNAQSIGPSNTITVSVAVSVGTLIASAAEFAGLAASGALDRTARASGNSTMLIVGPSALTSQAEELLVTSFNYGGGAASFTMGTNGTINNCTNTGDTTYGTLPSANIGGIFIRPGYCIVSAAAQYEGNATLSSPLPWTGLLASYGAFSPTPTPTNTPTPTRTSTPTTTPTSTSTSTPTSTSTSTSTSTPTPTSTSTSTPTSTPTSTSTSTSTSTPTPTSTSTGTPTPTATATGTPTGTPTGTILPSSTGTPTVTPTPGATPCILGDVNCDGIVDLRDYAIWGQNFGQTNCGNRADLNGDCIVDTRDYGIWRANFGHTAPGAAQVPALARPLLGAPPVPGVRLPSLAWQPAPEEDTAGAAEGAGLWPTELLAHIGPVRPWEIAGGLAPRVAPWNHAPTDGVIQ